MTINSEWVRKDFKQKYFLFCREKNLEVKKYNEILAQVKDNNYICGGIIKIEQNDKKRN